MGLLVALAVLGLGWGQAQAQVERRDLPVLQGEPPPPAPQPTYQTQPSSPPSAGYEQRYEPGYQPQAPYPQPAPSAGYEPHDKNEAPMRLQPLSRPQETYAPPAEEPAWPSSTPQEPSPGGATGVGSDTVLPADLWRGMDAGAMQTLLQQTPLPSPSPALARLIARSLAAGAPSDDREISVRAAALKRGGRAEELAQLLRQPVHSLASESEGGGGAASPMALFFLAQDAQEDAELRLSAAEKAASLNVIDGTALARAYREVAPKLPQSARSPASLRAKLFASLDAQASPEPRAESIDALLASGKDARIEIPIAEALAAASASLAQDRAAARFAETGVRVAALSGGDQAAWAWVDTGGERVQSWQLLLGAADPNGERARAALASGVDIATRSKLPGPVLQRLVTVLDALGEDVPIPLWDLASQSPSPEDGYLPPTGVLSALKQASDNGEVGRTVLLAAAALGPKGPQDAHLIALGDSLRALKQVGLDAEARRIALEALALDWPSHGKV